MISIEPTKIEEAEHLSQIQKRAFKPLYEKYHDQGNPYLRGAEDIQRRLNKFYRYFTISYDGKIVGGIFYRCIGKRSSTAELGEGDYYLQRIYVDPEYQNKGIAREAILLCEKEFPDAKAFYVDFPKDMEKNRRCYEHAGFCDTGEEINVEGVPVLSVYKKTVSVAGCPDPVRFPMIFEVEETELTRCLEVIHRSFATVAAEFALTPENCPKHTSFMPLCFLEAQMGWGWHMLGLYAGKQMIGYMSVSAEADNAYELHNLAILPEYRHCGYGKQLLDHAKTLVKQLDGAKLKVGIIEESAVLRRWYEENGFVHTGTKKFDHLPFTSGYLEWRNC